MRIALLFLITVCLSGCANQFSSLTRQGDPLRDNPRILFRDLTKPYHVPKHPNRNYGVIATRYQTDKRHGFITEIQFANESIVPSDVMLFTGLIKDALRDKGAKVVLVGHSHGKSQVGNGRLALRRTQAVARLLVKAKIAPCRIIQVATWSTVAKGSMSKAVRAYIVPSNAAWINVKVLNA